MLDKEFDVGIDLGKEEKTVITEIKVVKKEKQLAKILVTERINGFYIINKIGTNEFKKLPFGSPLFVKKGTFDVETVEFNKLEDYKKGRK